MEGGPQPPLPGGADIIGRASELVELTNGANDVVHTLLGDVAVVATLDAAVAMRRAGFAGRIARGKGEWLSAEGVVGVRGKSDGDGSLLGRKEQIQSLRDRLGVLETSAAELTSRRAAASAEREPLIGLIADTAAELAAVQATASERQMAAGPVQAELEKLPSQRQAFDAERAQAAAERASLEAEAGQVCEDEATIIHAITEGESVLVEAQSGLRAAQKTATS